MKLTEVFKSYVSYIELVSIKLVSAFGIPLIVFILF